MNEEELNRILMELDYYRDKYINMMEDFSALKSQLITLLIEVQRRSRGE